MTSVRSAKSKGSQMEYDCQHSLTKIFPTIYRTAERGFQKKYDLACDEQNTYFECKRLKAMSWNQAKKYLDKLELVTPPQCKCYLLFKSNHQPCLVMYYTKEYVKLGNEWFVTVREFEDVFGVLFEKHPSTRAKKDGI